MRSLPSVHFLGSARSWAHLTRLRQELASAVNRVLRPPDDPAALPSLSGERSPQAQASPPSRADLGWRTGEELVLGFEYESMQAVIDRLLYTLRRAPATERLARSPELLEALVDAAGPLRMSDLVSVVEGRLSRSLTEDQQLLLRDSLALTASYLALDDHPLLEASPVFPAGPPPPEGSYARFRGYDPEVEALNLRDLAWKDVDGYVQSRLGPVTRIIDTLTSHDEVVFSNLPFQDLLACGLGEVRSVRRLNLPNSSWSKELHVAEREDGSRVLVMSSFLGKVLLQHHQALVKHRIGTRTDWEADRGPRIQTVHAPGQYEDSYHSLARFFEEKEDDLGRLDALVAGYGNAFAHSWERHPSRMISNGDWYAVVFDLPSGKRVAVLERFEPASWHGELLGENLRRALEARPEIRHVYLGGSAGSLHVRRPYAFVHPSRILGSDGSELPNALSTGSDGMGHVSVLSPLQETPQYLEGLQRANVTTLDMEMGFVARALTGLDVAVGIAMLVTDFPSGLGITGDFSLAFQDAGKKARALAAFPEAVERALAQDHRALPSPHPLELETGRRFAEVSRENARRKLDELGPLTPEEEQLLRRVLELPLEYSFRMTAKRLRRQLDDGAFLATSLVAELRNPDIHPTTPVHEHALYGAWDYTFGSVSFDGGRDKYGEVKVRVRPEVWQARSWASERPGIHFLKEVTGLTHDGPEMLEPDVLGVAREAMLGDVLLPEDYPLAIAASVIRQVRQLSPNLRQELFAAEGKALAELLGEQFLGRLEARIRDSLNPVDIAEIVVPTTLDASVREKLEASGIPFRFE